METKPTYEELEQRVKELEKEAEMRKRAEEELERIFNLTPELICTANEDGYFKRLNPVWEDVLGYSINELLSKPFLDFIHPDDREPTIKEVEKQVNGKPTFNFGNRYLCKDGSYKVLEWNASPADSDGMLYAAARDITESKKAEEKLRASEEKYRGLIEGLNDAVYRMSLPDGRYEYFSPGARSVFGYTSKNFIDNPLFIQEIIHPDYFDYFQNEWAALLEGKVPPIYEYKVIDSNGNERWIIQSNKGMFDHQGNIIAIEGICRNVTDRKLSEETLRESEEKYQDLYDNAPDMFVSVDAKTANIVECNQTLANALDYSKDEIIGRPVFDIYTPDSAEYAKEIVFPVFKKTGSIQVEELQLQRKDGSKIDVSLNVSAVRDDQGNIINSRSIWRDITDRRQLENQLRQSQKMEAIGTLAGGIAHEFNNILGIIMGNTELAIDDVPEWNPAKNCLEEIRTASLRAKDVVRHILSFARKTHIERKPVPISPIIRDSFKLLRASLPSSIDIRQDFSCEHDTVLADPTQINQVLVNICTNSAHAMREEGGVLDVKLEDVLLGEETVTQYEDLSPGSYVKLTVKDTGHGIKPENLIRIFDPYFTTKGVGEGTGMGLSVVHGIIKSHDGAITVSSELGKGTVVEVLLPITEAEIEHEVVEPKELPTGSEKILFVDDEESLVEMVPLMLERLGYQVEAKTNPDEALELFRTKSDEFDLVISDMTMPQMRGDKLAQKLMEIRPDIPIIISTGFSEKMDEDKAKAMGIRAVAMKPLVMRTLAKTVRKVLDEK